MTGGGWGGRRAGPSFRHPAAALPAPARVVLRMAHQSVTLASDMGKGQFGRIILPLVTQPSVLMRGWAGSDCVSHTLSGWKALMVMEGPLGPSLWCPGLPSAH